MESVQVCAAMPRTRVQRSPARRSRWHTHRPVRTHPPDSSAPPLVDDSTRVPLLHAPRIFPEDDFPGEFVTRMDLTRMDLTRSALRVLRQGGGLSLPGGCSYAYRQRRSYYFERTKHRGTNEFVCSCYSPRAHSQSTTLRYRRRPSPLAPLPPPPPPLRPLRRRLARGRVPKSDRPPRRTHRVRRRRRIRGGNGWTLRCAAWVPTGPT